MIRIAHLSDLHFGSEDAATADALVGELNRERLDLVILSGDLTMAARRHEFSRARAFVDALNAPVLCVPGNHDISPYRLIERFLRPYARWREHLSQELEPVWFSEDVAVVGINTARRMRLRLDWSLGAVSPKQIAALPARFAEAPKTTRFRIVVAHHPFLEEREADLSGRPKVMVKRAVEALETFARARVDLVTAGHLHRTYAAAFEGNGGREASASNVVASEAHAAQRVTVIQAGTALSSRTRREPNSFNRIEIEGDRLAVHPVMWLDTRWERDPEPMVVIEKGPASG